MMSAGPGMPTRPPRLLVVDDHPFTLDALAVIFEPDHVVLRALSGEQAIALCSNPDELPDLILLDVEMPGMGGHELCARLKSQPATRDIPIIFVTGHDSLLQEAEGLAIGAVDFIAKPVNAEVVRARVRTHLTLKSQSDLLKQWVYIDGMTGIFNRRYFDERLQAEWARAARQRTPLSVIMMDVDHFKRYNDHYGHQQGDECLRQVAQTIREALKRPGDLVARYGGEEFVCLLPETDLMGAVNVAANIRLAIHDMQRPHAHSPTAQFVTLSLGVCSAIHGQERSQSADQLLAGADQQLYLAKTKGRNQLCGGELPTAI